MNKLAKIGIWAVGITAVIFVVALIIFGIWRGVWVTNVEKHEFAFTFDRFDDGKIEILNRSGWIIRNPFRYAVHTIDLRPYQIPIIANIGNSNSSSSSSSNISSRVLNAKLVKFNPDGFDTYIKWHGRHAGDNLNNLLEIMKAYAFDKESGKDCPFITVVDEMNPGQAPTSIGGKR